METVLFWKFEKSLLFVSTSQLKLWKNCYEKIVSTEEIKSGLTIYSLQKLVFLFPLKVISISLRAQQKLRGSGSKDWWTIDIGFGLNNAHRANRSEYSTVFFKALVTLRKFEGDSHRITPSSNEWHSSQLGPISVV